MLIIRAHPRPNLVSTLLLLLMITGSYYPASASGFSVDAPQYPDTRNRGQVSKETALAEAYLTGKGVPRDLKQSAYWYERAAAMGDPVAQNQIGYFYEVGLGVTRDPVRAVHWYQLASANGFANAKVNLAVAYIWGIGTQKDPAMGERLLHEAVAKGNSVAASYLGDLYYLGIGIPKDEAAAERWYEKAVKMHSYIAEYRLGIMLSEPGGHSHDAKRALSLFRQSAAAGFVPAMHSLGRLLVNHPDLCSSHQEALNLLNDAASAGTWQSSFVLGALARDGKWVPQDDRQAYFHFRAGAIQGGEKAQILVENDLKALSDRISSEERAQLDEEAEAWAHEHATLLSILYKGQNGGLSAGSIALTSPAPGAHAGVLLPMTAF